MATEQTPPDDRPGDDAPPTSGDPLGLLLPELTEGESRFLDHEAVAIGDRRRQTMALYRRGLSMRAVVDELKRLGYERTSLATVARDLHAVIDGYKRLAARDARDHLADQLQRLAHREAEIERDLKRSRGETVESSSSRRATAAGPQDQATIKRRSKYGDPRLHALLQQYWVQRCKLLGLFRDGDAGKVVPTKLVAGIDPLDEV